MRLPWQRYICGSKYGCFCLSPQVTYLHTKIEGGLNFFISNFASLSRRIALKSSAISPGLIHHAKWNMIFAVTFLFLVIVLEVKGDCLTGRCEKISLDVYQDAVHDSEFVGHVFHNSVTLNPIQCYMKCIQDCRCLSVNYKENNDQKYCELNEGNHFTEKTSLKQSLGSRYYILHRDYSSEVMLSALLTGNVLFSCYLMFKD